MGQLAIVQAVADRADLPALFVSSGNEIEEIVTRIEAEARNQVFDVSTKKGQDDLRSHAHAIRKAKAALEKAGKEQKDQYTVTTKKIDESRRSVRERLDALYEEVRQPLTALEEAEKARVAGHESNLAALKDKINCDGLTAAQIEERINLIDSKEIKKDVWDEFYTQALETKNSVLAELKAKHANALKAEAEAAELERLRQAEAERQQKEREERIAKEAAEAAKREAEQKAEAARLEQERAAQAAAEREARLVAEKEAAELRAKQAAQAERERLELEAKKAAEEEAQRKADAEHRQSVEKDIFNALAELHSVSDDAAAAVTEALVCGLIPNVKVSF